MITTPTTFIVGAGASVGYGFPLGATLVAEIAHAADGAHESPIGNVLREVGYVSDVLYEFARKLRYSALYSIDAFLEQNDPSLVEIGKAAIALLILRAEQVCKSEERLFGKAPPDHWLRYVWNSMRSGCQRDTLIENQVRFITFNYDRTIEYFLDRVLESAFNLDPASATQLREECVPIVHVHGTPKGGFGDYPRSPTEAFVRELVEGVRVVHDSLAADSAEFTTAHEWIGKSTRICFLGFGYHEVNIRRLRLADIAQKAQVSGCAYKMEQAEIALATARLGVNCTLQNNCESEKFLRRFVGL